MLKKVAQILVVRPKFFNAVRRVCTGLREEGVAKADGFISHVLYVGGYEDVVARARKFTEAAEQCIVGLQLWWQNVRNRGIGSVQRFKMPCRCRRIGIVRVVPLQDI